MFCLLNLAKGVFRRIGFWQATGVGRIGRLHHWQKPISLFSYIYVSKNDTDLVLLHPTTARPRD